MKYTIAPFQVIHWDSLAQFGGKDPMSGRLDLKYEIYSLSQAGELPVLLKWTLTIYRECDLLFKYAAESKILIECDHKDDDGKEIELIIKDSLLDFEMYWEEHTGDTPLFGQAIPGFPDSSIYKIVDDIMQHCTSFAAHP